MLSSHSTCRSTIAALAAGVAVAMAAPAQAGSAGPVRPDDRADRTVASAEQSSPVRPDDRAYRGIGAVPVAASVRPDDRADRKLPFATSDGGMFTGENKRDVRLGVNYEPTLVAGRSHSLDWGDARIGAGGALGLAVLVVILTVAALRYRRPAAS